jgi:hypothetical protein
MRNRTELMFQVVTVNRIGRGMTLAAIGHQHGEAGALSRDLGCPCGRG